VDTAFVMPENIGFFVVRWIRRCTFTRDIDSRSGRGDMLTLIVISSRYDHVCEAELIVRNNYPAVCASDPLRFPQGLNEFAW
jgi:hypothetical protein